MHYRPNAIYIPNCNSSKTAIDTLASFYKCVLQKFPTCEISTNRKVLERRIQQWQDDNISELYDEARILQERLENKKSN
ncbi:hypothetical protein GJ496_004980 [Pomphorhynchus laevis]|nr:hypothetical protein GJ496_004980 [Pomphorhynchus laevis]